MNDISHKIYIFSLKSVGRLVRLSPLLTLRTKSAGFKSKQARKEEQKIKVLPGDQKSETNFSRIQSGNKKTKLRIKILRVILSDRNFGFYKKNIQNPTRSFGLAETGEILEVSVGNKLLCREIKNFSFWFTGILVK
jgi:hypothetical protein